jgi:two-component system cell cycle response regulator DivK
MLQKPETRDIPVIAVTAHALVTEQEDILKAGCRACLPKPIDFKQLKNELDRWLRDSRILQTNS